MTTKKPRERKHDFNRMRSTTIGIIARVAREKLSHSEFLDLRTSELFARDEWKRLTALSQQELLGMLRGAEKAWHACGAIVWTHTIAGKVYLSPLSSDLAWGYAWIESSTHRWSADLTRVWFQGSNTMEPYAQLEANEAQ